MKHDKTTIRVKIDDLVLLAVQIARHAELVREYGCDSEEDREALSEDLTEMFGILAAIVSQGMKNAGMSLEDYTKAILKAMEQVKKDANEAIEEARKESQIPFHVHKEGNA